VIEHRRSDIVVVQNDNKTTLLIDITVSGDTKVEEKEQEKVDKYQNLAPELKKYYAFCEQRTNTLYRPILIGKQQESFDFVLKVGRESGTGTQTVLESEY